MKFHEKLRTTRSWTHFFTCALCDEEGRDLTAEDCCGLPGDLWGLGVLLEERSCWVRYVIIVSLLSFVLFILAQLLKTLWQIFRSLLGRKSKSCQNLPEKEYDCRHLTKAFENEKSQCNKEIAKEQNERKIAEIDCNNEKPSSSKQSTKVTSLNQVDCDRNLDMKPARSCSSNLISTVECNAQSYPQDKMVTPQADVPYAQNPHEDISERTKCTEHSTSNGHEFSMHTIDEPDPCYPIVSTRKIATTCDPNCSCDPNPCVCNYNPMKYMCWGPDYYPTYNRNLSLDVGINQDWKYLCQYDVDRRFTPNYFQSHYRPKSKGRYEVKREDSVELLYSRADNNRGEHFGSDPRLTSSPTRQQQFEPKYHSTREETHGISDSSPLRYSPERSQYKGKEYINDQNRIHENTTYLKYPRLKNEFVANEYDERNYNKNDITNERVNATTGIETDYNSRAARITNKETGANHIQVQTDNVSSTADENKPHDKQVQPHKKKNFSIPKEGRTTSVNEKILSEADPHSTPNKFTMNKTREKNIKIVKHHADLSEQHHVKKTSREITSTGMKNQHQITQNVEKPLKIKIYDRKRFYPLDESKVHKYVSVKTNTNSPLTTVTQTNGKNPRVRQCPRKCEQSPKTKGNHDETNDPHDWRTLISSSDDSKENSMGITEETVSSEATDVSMDVNQPDNIKPQQRSKTKKLSRPRQSPVNIELNNCLPLYIEDPLTWYSYTNIPLSMKISNWNGTVALSGVWNSKEVPRISGGPLFNDVYVFDKLLFKWGACDHTGSEHATDGKFYPLERQMIFSRDTQSVYSMMESPERGCNNPDCIVSNCRDLQHRGVLAQRQEDTIINHCRPCMMSSAARVKDKDTRESEETSLEYVIISSFYEIFECDPYSRNISLDSILKYIKFVQIPDSSYSIPMFSLDMIQEPFNCNYYSYFGSMTIPPYSESVLWIIHPDISFVSKQQMASLREIKLKNGENVLSNRRAIQPLNRRKIFLFC